MNTRETRADQIDRETAFLRAFQRKADAVGRLILATDLPWVDIAIQVEALRRDVARWYPQKLSLFAMIYDSRFRRLWRQWRKAGTP